MLFGADLGGAFNIKEVLRIYCSKRARIYRIEGKFIECLRCRVYSLQVNYYDFSIRILYY